jgi:hypothetical protein
MLICPLFVLAVQSKADENSKTVLPTSMTAKQVNINTQAHTQLTGSLIAATDTGDKDGKSGFWLCVCFVRWILLGFWC